MPSSPDPSPPGGGLRPEHPPVTQLRDLAAAVGATVGTVAPGATTSAAGIPVFVTGVDLRAQGVQPGDLFAALPGARAHGAEYAAEALERGAVAVLTDAAGCEHLAAVVTRPVPVLVHPDPRSVLGVVSAAIYGDPSQHMQVVGITGTSGKTTSAYLVEAGLAAAGRVTGLVGTIETRLAGRRVPSALTTPEAPQLHALFAAMREQGIDTVVMEVSSHALSLGRVAGVRFAVGAFTNLSQDHLDFHRDLDDYFGAKARLFAADSPVRARRAVVCIDDEWGVRMAGIARAAHPAEPEAVRTVATTGTADWTATAVRTEPSGSQVFTLAGPDGTARRVAVRLPGHYNVANAALAVAVCAAVGVDVDAAAAGIADVDVPGRVERVDRGQGFLAVVDYAHKPAALEAVIATLRGRAAGGRLAVVVGAGGNRDHGKRPLMGDVGARGADLLVVTDDNPRTEDPAVIRAALLAGARAVPEQQRGEIREIGDRAAAVEAAVRWARPGDIVLVAGKGHETGQEIHGVKHPFDDREVLAAAIDRFAGAGSEQYGGTE
ncbi:UDP-N-acetylmuramoyl-L-alanyl-D-glutamate--2,6-diaminopimelate ligase [Rhodococcus sp. YH1]|uniref:UDP-N-acetylmuramoyl-L-alanyl-D-glutamate--2, 6-diaminopimelate ligase n=1 Tax=Rhodococcus sp. YH1 TaxID=89066 RepID=UPI001A072705|nr:UDP-N-acetylmuramoyl-L-alanyl-D-glutamate--2,6-diaminopimelate ligase [Rhodococcus sp. YH1]